MTDNHRLNTPQKGTSDWHVPLNENFEAIDTGIEVRDVSTNKSDYVPKNGAKFFATDTDTVYIGNGERWEPVRSSGQSPSFRSVALNGEYMNSWPQTDYQVGSGDSIQDAVDQLSDTTDCAVVDITKGYDGSVESRPIVVDHPVEFIGRGLGKNSRLEFPTDGTPVFQINKTANPKFRVGFRNLWVKGGSIGLDIQSAENLYTQNCYFSEQRDHGIDYSGGEFSGWSIHFHTIVHSAQNGPGWELRNAKVEPNATKMIECQSLNTGGIGVGLGGYATSWRGGSIERSDGPGLVFDGPRGTHVIEDVYFESNGKQASGLRDTDIYVADRGTWDTTIKHTWQAGSGPADWHIVIGGGDSSTRNVTVIEPHNFDARFFPRDKHTGRVKVTSGAQDCHLRYNDAKVPTVIDDGAQRIVQNNKSTNQGDPRSSGEWNGRGYTGLSVRDTVNGNWWEYVNGQWVPG